MFHSLIAQNLVDETTVLLDNTTVKVHSMADGLVQHFVLQWKTQQHLHGERAVGAFDLTGKIVLADKDLTVINLLNGWKSAAGAPSFPAASLSNTL
jgi:hypothetical protein